MSSDRVGENRRAVADYERTAGEYVSTVDGRPSASADALHRLAGAVGPAGRVLEIGSGPGWDADALEALGIDVHRTDAAMAFCEFQAERGKRCDRLDLLADPIQGRYGGVMMLCVLQHFARSRLEGILRKLAGALETDGALLLMYPEGEDDAWEHGSAGDYRVVRWTVVAMDARLTQAEFEVAWDEAREGRGGSWRTVLARKR
ncbi:class I SAM-dependent methyltransferase [Luteimonas kalidii]|uniref:Methyltransferase domain-containing protein n=1 Tax=Luteimonas kalidii TaxID=3042025 RepID=A0ABT6JRV9_9GAMM|nr:methyltransferase domain-containing protein [Luteimonas kalidii]MDH5833423.1 methyltransferase domain-containing protein [Luteimonas kalidii]